MKKNVILCVALLIAVFTTISSAALVTDISVTGQPFTEFYNGTAQTFGFEAAPLMIGDIGLENSGLYNYYITGGTVSFTPVDLIGNNPVGTLAVGEFKGGAILTITGVLNNRTTSSTSTPGVILIAEMVIDSSGSWLLVEDPKTKEMEAAISMIPTGGLLFDGTFEDLTIGELTAGISCKHPSEDIDTFGGDPYSAGSDGIVVQLHSVPEPATVVMLSLGSFVLLRRRKL